MDAETFVTEPGVKEVRSVDAIFALLKELAVHAVLAVLRGVDEVAVLAVPGPRRVIGILIANGDERHARNTRLEFSELIEEVPGRIEYFAILQWIELVALPFFLAINGMHSGSHRTWVIQGHDVTAALVRLSSVEKALIAMRSAKPETTFRAPNGLRDFCHVVAEGECHISSVLQLIWFFCELLAAIDAGGRHAKESYSKIQSEILKNLLTE